MPDLLVNLLKLTPLEANSDQPFVIRRAQPFELTPVRQFIEKEFSLAWADEATIGFSNKPLSVFIATLSGEIIGFAAYECTRRAYFGPTGVGETVRGRGVGRALLMAALWGLRELGYVYAIIGGAGPVQFYQKEVGAIVIPDSEPGIYTDSLKRSN
jgi:GNAT superfamily N-acetyltransferase